MIKSSIVLLILYMSLFGNSNPNLYSLLGDKLFDANIKLEKLKFINNLTKRIESYQEKSTFVQNKGLELESKEIYTAEEKKQYLNLLRDLEKNYASIVGSLQQELKDTIKNQDYIQFIQISNSGLKDIFDTSTIQNQVIEYYQKNKKKGTVESLEQLIQQNKLEKEARLSQWKQDNEKVTDKTQKPKKKYIIEVKPYKDSYGNDYKMKLNVSFEECKDYCLKDSECKAYFFNSKRDKCWFKNKVGRITDVRYGTLGIKKPVNR